MNSLEDIIRAIVRDELARSSRPTDEYLSTTAAAQFADVSVGTIRRWVREGKLKEHRAGRSVRVRRQDLERLLSKVPERTGLDPEAIARRVFG